MSKNKHYIGDVINLFLLVLTTCVLYGVVIPIRWVIARLTWSGNRPMFVVGLWFINQSVLLLLIGYLGIGFYTLGDRLQFNEPYKQSYEALVVLVASSIALLILIYPHIPPREKPAKE